MRKWVMITLISILILGCTAKKEQASKDVSVLQSKTPSVSEKSDTVDKEAELKKQEEGG